MLRFESPIYLYLLLLIPVLVIGILLLELHRKKMLLRFADKSLIACLMPMASVKRRLTKYALLLSILAVLIVIAARPQMGTKVSNEVRNGIECIIALDISNSMLAQDVTPSRLDKSKMLIEGLVDKFSNDKIGLVVFAGDAFVQLPITSDYVSAKMFLRDIEPSLIQTQGTDIAKAISIASNSFTQQEKIGKAIIVITDGEDHEGGALEAAKAARDKGMNVFILGVGNVNGAPIPSGDGGYMKDNSGNTVMTALNEQMCRDIAAAGKGTYIHVDNTSSAQSSLNDELTKLQQGEMRSVMYSEYNEQFQAFGILCVLLMILEICILETKNPLFSHFSIFKKNKAAMLFFILLLVPIIGIAQNDRSHIRMGNVEYHRGKIVESEVEYRKALQKNPNNAQAVYNLGCALMQQQKDSAAIEEFSKAVKMETSKKRRFMSYHNIGVIAQKKQLYQDAINAYKEALRLNPSDDETRYNLALCKKMLKNQPQNQNNNQNKDNKDNKKDNDKDKQNKDQNKDQQDKNDKDQQKQQNNDMSKENAERLLDAALQQEKATQNRMKKAMQKPQRRNLQKNW